MKLEQLIENYKIIKINNFVELDISSIEFDSRKCKQGSLFVAIKGEKSNGNDYIDSAINLGAIAILSDDKSIFEKYNHIPIVLVKNARNALAYISHKFYQNPTSKLKVIGVTGTNGKTSITYMIQSVLAKAGHKVAIIGTTGAYIGNELIETNHTTPESRDLAEIFSIMLEKDVKFVIMEVSSHSLVLNRVDYINFDIAIFSNLSHDHLDFHKTMKKYAQAKSLLFSMLPQTGFAVVNGDDIYHEDMIKNCKAKILKVGRKETNRFIINSEKLSIDSSTFSISNGISIAVRTIIPGKFNVENVALSAVASLALNIDLRYIIDGLAECRGAKGRMQAIKLKSGAIGIVDYAHTPDALEKALNSCKNILKDYPNSKLICVFGCGGDRDKTKRPKMGKIAAENADLIFITNDNPRTEDPTSIIADIKDGVSREDIHKVLEIMERSEAIKAAGKVANENDILLVAGKGHEIYQIIGTTKHHFDDMEELQKN